LSYRFKTPVFDERGGGGYIKLNLFKEQKLDKIILLHWGAREDQVKLMYRSWFSNATGENPDIDAIRRMIDSHDMLSLPLTFTGKQQHLQIDLAKVVAALENKQGHTEWQPGSYKMTIAHGVWSRVMQHEEGLISELEVDRVQLRRLEKRPVAPVTINGKTYNLELADKKNPYYQF